MQEQVIPLRCVRGALRGATILVDRLDMMAGALEQVCTSRSQPVVRREAWIQRELVQGSQAGLGAVDHREGNRAAEAHHRAVLESKHFVEGENLWPVCRLGAWRFVVECGDGRLYLVRTDGALRERSLEDPLAL